MPGTEKPLRPCDLTVAEIGERFRRGDLTPASLMESLLAQVRRLEPSIKAWTTLDEEKALTAARQAEEEIALDGMRSPLHGVLVKRVERLLRIYF